MKDRLIQSVGPQKIFFDRIYWNLNQRLECWFKLHVVYTIL
jgi:hypothetical protein